MRFPTSLRRWLAAAGAVAALLPALTAVAGPAAAAPPVPPAPDLGAAIEPMAPYQPQSFCDPTAKPGVVKFAALLEKTYPSTESWGITRACDAEAGTSEHKDGRAFDWHADYRDPAARAQATALIHWLFATDRYGNAYAMARRFGIMYIIYNSKIWGAWDPDAGWKPYSCSGVTACHIDHVHFSFDWAGAEGITSYWTHKVAPFTPPPGVPVYDSLTDHRTVSVPARSSSVTTPFLLVAGHTYTLTVSGTVKYSTAASGVGDAACLQRSSWQLQSWGRLVAGPVGRWAPTTGGSGCNTRSHTYTATFTPRSTDTLRLSFDDSSRTDNSGAFTVTVQRTR